MNGTGIVTGIDGERATVRVTTGSECQGCASRHSCHMSEGKVREITVINEYGAGVSDHVAFEADTGKVILSAALVWIVPIVSMIVGYRVSMVFAGGIVPVLSAFVFLGASFAFLKLLDARLSGGTTFYPHVTGIVEADADDRLCGPST